MSERPHDLLDRVDRRRLLRLLTELLEAYSPSYAEEPAMEVLAGALGEAGLTYVRQPVPQHARGEGQGNLIVELGPQPPALLWVGHVDTVPPTEEEQLAPRTDGDDLHGLGAADMKSGCAAAVEALLALAASGREPRRGVAVAFVVGEEEYGDGSEALLRRVEAPLTIVGEPTGLAPCTAHHGYLEYRLQCRGEQVHAALPELGGSAIHGMLSWLLALEEGAREVEPHGALSVNPREIAGGGQGFVVAERCEALVDAHIAPSLDAKRVETIVDAARATAQAGHVRCSFSWELTFASDGYHADPAMDGFDPLRRAFRQVGLAWEPGTFRSHSDAPMYAGAGSATVVCGPGSLEVAHTRHERVSIRETVLAARLYAALFHEICDTP